MNYAIARDDKGNVINVKMTGLLNSVIRKEVLLVVANELNITNYFKVIIDLTETTFDPQEPMLNALALIDYMKVIGIGSNVKMAFIYNEAEKQRKFFENIAQTEGLNIRYFTEAADAKAWLAS